MTPVFAGMLVESVLVVSMSCYLGTFKPLQMIFPFTMAVLYCFALFVEQWNGR